MESLIFSACKLTQKKFKKHKRKKENKLVLAFAYSLSDLTALFKITHYYYFTA